MLRRNLRRVLRSEAVILSVCRVGPVLAACGIPPIHLENDWGRRDPSVTDLTLQKITRSLRVDPTAVGSFLRLPRFRAIVPVFDRSEV